MDQSVIDAYEAPVEAATQQAEADAQSVSDPTLRGQTVKATAMLRSAVDSWKGEQLAEVQSGAKEESWWTDYGKSLLDQAGRYVRDNSSFFSQWSNAINVAGNAAQAVEDYVTSNIQSWRTVVDGYNEQYQAFITQETTTEQLAQTLLPAKGTLPPDLEELIFGPTAQAASDTLALLGEALQKADLLVSALESGAQAVFAGSDIQLAPNQSVPGLQGRPRLGSPLLVGGAVLAGLIALLTLCGSLVAWLFSYYQHIGQVTQSKAVQDALGTATGALQTLNDPNATPEAKAAASQIVAAATDAAKKLAAQAPPDPFGGLSSVLAKFEQAASAVITGTLVVAVGYVVWRNREELLAAIKALWEKLTRKKNPRRRPRKKLKGARA